MKREHESRKSTRIEINSLSFPCAFVRVPDSAEWFCSEIRNELHSDASMTTVVHWSICGFYRGCNRNECESKPDSPKSKWIDQLKLVLSLGSPPCESISIRRRRGEIQSDVLSGKRTRGFKSKWIHLIKCWGKHRKENKIRLVNLETFSVNSISFSACRGFSFFSLTCKHSRTVLTML